MSSICNTTVGGALCGHLTNNSQAPMLWRNGTNSSTQVSIEKPSSSSPNHLTVWIPYLSVICLTAVCFTLSLSFFQHWKRVDKRRRTIQDYLELDIDLNRKRISSMMRATVQPHRYGGSHSFTDKDEHSGGCLQSFKYNSSSCDSIPPENYYFNGAIGGVDRYEYISNPMLGIGSDGMNYHRCKCEMRQHQHQNNLFPPTCTSQHNLNHNHHNDNKHHHCAISCKVCWRTLQQELWNLFMKYQGEGHAKRHESLFCCQSQSIGDCESGRNFDPEYQTKGQSIRNTNLGSIKSKSSKKKILISEDSNCSNEQGKSDIEKEGSETQEYISIGEIPPMKYEKEMQSPIFRKTRQPNQGNEQTRELFRQRNITLLDNHTASDPELVKNKIRNVFPSSKECSLQVNKIDSSSSSGHLPICLSASNDSFLHKGVCFGRPKLHRNLEAKCSTSSVQSDSQLTVNGQIHDSKVTQSFCALGLSNQTFTMNKASSFPHQDKAYSNFVDNGGVINYGFQAETCNQAKASSDSTPGAFRKSDEIDNKNEHILSSQSSGDSSITTSEKRSTGKKRKSFLKTYKQIQKRFAQDSTENLQINSVPRMESMNSSHNDVISLSTLNPYSIDSQLENRIELSIIDVNDNNISQAQNENRIYISQHCYPDNDINI